MAQTKYYIVTPQRKFTPGQCGDLTRLLKGLDYKTVPLDDWNGQTVTKWSDLVYGVEITAALVQIITGISTHWQHLTHLEDGTLAPVQWGTFNSSTNLDALCQRHLGAGLARQTMILQELWFALPREVQYETMSGFVKDWPGLNPRKARIVRVGVVEDGEVKHWEFDCAENAVPAFALAADGNHLHAGYTLAELAEISEQRRLQFSYQSRVYHWLMACFGETIIRDKAERNFRFLEEAMELVQACGGERSDAYELADYVWDRPVGEPKQEVGGVMVTLAALCIAHEMDMRQCGETELARVWTKLEEIRRKHAAKVNPGGPLP